MELGKHSLGGVSKAVAKNVARISFGKSTKKIRKIFLRIGGSEKSSGGKIVIELLNPLCPSRGEPDRSRARPEYGPSRGGPVPGRARPRRANPVNLSSNNVCQAALVALRRRRCGSGGAASPSAPLRLGICAPNFPPPIHQYSCESRRKGIKICDARSPPKWSVMRRQVMPRRAAASSILIESCPARESNTPPFGPPHLSFSSLPSSHSFKPFPLHNFLARRSSQRFQILRLRQFLTHYRPAMPFGNKKIF